MVFLCRCAESNRGPIDYESIALPTELQRRNYILYGKLFFVDIVIISDDT